MSQDDNNSLNGSPDKKSETAKKAGILGKITDLVKIKSRGEKENNAGKNGSDVNFIGSNFIAAPIQETKGKFIFLAAMLLCNIAVAALIYAALIVKEKMSFGNISNLENEKAQIEKQIQESRADENKIAQIKTKIILANTFLDKHLYWDKFFEIMESRTVQGVRYETFKIDNTGQLKLDAVAENFEVLSQQISKFNNSADYFSNIEMSSVSVDQDKKTGKIGGIDFFISMNVDTDIFYKKE